MQGMMNQGERLGIKFQILFEEMFVCVLVENVNCEPDSWNLRMKRMPSSGFAWGSMEEEQMLPLLHGGSDWY